MGCVVDIRKAIIEIPKNGSQSMVVAMKSLGDYVAGGHRPLYDMQQTLARKGHDPNAVRYAAQIRNPVDRLVSAINAFVKNRRLMSPEKVLKDFTPEKDPIFWRQIDMIEDEQEVTLFKFGTRDIYDWMGYEQPMPHVNPGTYEHPFEELIQYHDFKRALGMYSYDYQLWELVKG